MEEYLLDDIPRLRQQLKAHETNLLSVTKDIQEEFQRENIEDENLEEGQTQVIKYFRKVKTFLYSIISVISAAVLILSIMRVQFSWDSKNYIYKDTKTTKKFAYSCFALCLFNSILLFIFFF